MNSRTFSTVKISTKLYENMKKNKIEPKKKEYKSLIENGFIVDNESKRYYNEINNALTHTDDFLLILAPTMSCNFRCKYCYETGILSYNKSDEERFIKLLTKFVMDLKKKNEIKALKIVLFGGEPTLVSVPTLNKMISILNKTNIAYNFDIFSNGYYFSNEFIKWCESVPITNVQITIDGMKECHDANRVLENGKGTFDIIFNNLSIILNKKITDEVIIRMNCTKENIDSMKLLIGELSNVYTSKKEMIRFSFGQLGIGKSELANKVVNKLTSEDKEYFIKFASLFIEAKKFGFFVPNHYAVGDICSNKRRSSVVISPTGLCKCMREIGRKNPKYSNNINMKMSLYDECFKKECPYIPYCHNGCLFTANLLGVDKVCRFKELDIINKELISQIYL